MTGKRYADEKVCSAMPILRQTSDACVPVSTWRKANAICSSVNFDFFLTKPSRVVSVFCQTSLI